MFHSLKTKILIYFTGITVIILFLFSYAFYYSLEEMVKFKIENDMYEKAIYIKDSINSKIPIQTILVDKKLDLFDVFILKNNKIEDYKGDVNFDVLKPYLGQKDAFFLIENGEIIHGIYNLRIQKPFNGNIVIYEDEIYNIAENIENILWVLEPVLLALLLFLVSKLIDKILVPIKNITQMANKISVNNLSNTIKEPTDEDEILELVNSFNIMIKRLKDGVTTLDRFNNDVSHELRTPLTVIKGEIEITLNKLRKPDYYIQSMSVIVLETNKMQKIVDDLLLLSKYSKDNISNTFVEISLDTLLIEVLDSYKHEIEQKSLHVSIKKLEPITLLANKMLIRAIFSNIIDNAIKYSTNEKNLYIHLYRDTQINFIVQDEGIGIAKENISKLTDKFYRVDESRNQLIKGFGLGLSIVKYALDLHNGQLHIDSSQAKGTTVTINL